MAHKIESIESNENNLFRLKDLNNLVSSDLLAYKENLELRPQTQ